MQPWIRVRQQLYLRFRAHVQTLLGEESKGTAHYRHDYDLEFQKSWKVSDRHSLLREVRESQILLIGDFHALHQSQRAALRLLRALPRKESLILALECFEARHQKILDQYLAQELTEAQFLQKISWKRNWGFPFESYRPLLRWAQGRGVRVVAINKRFQSHSAKTLQARDQFSADHIRAIREQNPESRIVVLFGDLHLARTHLPAALRMKGSADLGRILTVFQNSERLYFQLLKKGLELDVDVAKLGRDQFCLLSVPPWVKWQNYLLFLEQDLDHGMADGVMEYVDEIESHLRVFKQDLKVKLPDGSFAVHTPDDDGFWKQIISRPRREQMWLKEWAKSGHSFYLPDRQSGFLARPTVNHASGLATAILHAQLGGWDQVPCRMPKEFQKLIWIETIQYFGTKLINPKRKADTLRDVEARLRVLQKADLRLPVKERRILYRKNSHRHLELAALKLVLAQKKLEAQVQTRRGRTEKYSIGVYQEAARILGGILGEKLFLGVRSGKISRSRLLELVRRPVFAPEFEAFYFETLLLIESLPSAFLSKSEKL